MRSVVAIFAIGLLAIFAIGLGLTRMHGLRLVPDRVAASSNGGFACTVASVTDGDALRCTDGTRVRIAGINAREKDGTCNVGAPCPSASAEQATSVLSALAAGRVLQCQANGTTYDRIAAFCRTADGVDVSCAMMASGTVARSDRYWRGHRC
jgi:endonuclease YncB( thermonuclease family)